MMCYVPIKSGNQSINSEAFLLFSQLQKHIVPKIQNRDLICHGVNGASRFPPPPAYMVAPYNVDDDGDDGDGGDVVDDDDRYFEDSFSTANTNICCACAQYSHHICTTRRGTRTSRIHRQARRCVKMPDSNLRGKCLPVFKTSVH